MLLLCKRWHTQTNIYTWIMLSPCLLGAFSEDTGHALKVACKYSALGYSFTGRPIHAGSVLEVVVLGQVFLWIYWFSPWNYHTTNDHTSISFIYKRYYISLTINSTIQNNPPHPKKKNAWSYLLTPWSRVLLERLTSFQPVKKFPAIQGIWRFITITSISQPTNAHIISYKTL